MEHLKSSEFRGLLSSKIPDLSAEMVEKIDLFRALVLEENEKQNLTRLTKPTEFLYGHVWDVWELGKSGILDQVRSSSAPFLDLGSGMGVPGLLAAILWDDHWVLADSEMRKAEFLADVREKLDVLDRVEVLGGRAEDFLTENEVSGVFARAVGPVLRMYRWVRDTDGWKNLVLFKGPSWSEEWKEFGLKVKPGKLNIEREYSYHGQTKAGEISDRKLVWLKRGS